MAGSSKGCGPRYCAADIERVLVTGREVNAGHDVSVGRTCGAPRDERSLGRAEVVRRATNFPRGAGQLRPLESAPVLRPVSSRGGACHAESQRGAVQHIQRTTRRPDSLTLLRDFQILCGFGGRHHEGRRENTEEWQLGTERARLSLAARHGGDLPA